MTRRTIYLFMWGYQEHYRISLQILARDVLSKLGVMDDAYVLLVGARAPGSNNPKATLNKPSKSTACAAASAAPASNRKKRKISNDKRRFSFVSASRVRGFPNSGRSYPAYRGRVKYRFASASATNARVVFFSKPR